MTQSDAGDASASTGATGRRRFLQTIGAVGVIGVAGCGGDDTDTDGGNGNGNGNGTTTDGTTADGTTADGTTTGGNGNGNGTTDTETQTDTGTESPNTFPDPPSGLLSFEPENPQAYAGETLTIEGSVQNSYLFEIQNVEVTLGTPNDDWEITSDASVSFDAIASGEARDASWELAVPESTEDVELTATVSYESTDDEATAEVTAMVSVRSPPPDVTVDVTDGLVAQMDASQLSETDGLDAWQAVNTEGVAGVLTQSDEAARPSVVADASPTGESVTRFEGDGDFMSTDAPLTTATSGVTVIVGFRIDDETIPRQVLAYNGSDASGNGYGIILNSEQRQNADDFEEYQGHVDLLYGGVNWWFSGTTIQDDAIHVATMIIPEETPTEPRLFIDGQEVTSEFDTQGSPDTAVTPTDQYGIGQDVTTSSVSVGSHMDGDVGEELVYDRALSEDDREAVEGYLLEKWTGSDSGQ